MPDRQSRNFLEDRISPGTLYREIQVEKEDFEKTERQLEKKIDHWFVKFCKRVYSTFPSLGQGEKFSDENKKAVDFLSWNLHPEELGAAYKFVLVVSFFLALLLTAIIYLSPALKLVEVFAGDPFLAAVYTFVPLLGLAVYLTYFVQNFPVNEAKAEQVRSLTYVPEILGYMIMAMKLSPNLEKAIEFSAEHGRGKIAQEFRDLLWKVQIGVHTTVSEGLDKMAYAWGEFSDEFKKALMRVRASVIEPTEAKRHALLDKTMDEILESIKLKMEQYARDLSQPSVMLFYIGVLLPLILIIILPVGSSFSGAPLANPVFLALIYLIFIPGFTLWFAQSQIVSKRPPTVSSPVIPRNHPGIPPRYKMKLGDAMIDLRLVVAAVLVVGVGASFFLSTQGLPPKFIYEALNFENDTPQILAADRQRIDVLLRGGLPEDYFEVPSGLLYTQLLSRRIPQDQALALVQSEEKTFFTKPQNDIAPYNLVFGLLLTVSLAVFVFLYYDNIYLRKAQLEIIEMEEEFKDSLYVLASRMGENKPVEEAFKHTVAFLPDFKISRVFSKILDNITILAMPLDKAVFDKDYGALKHVPSSLIKGSMKLLVDSVELGVNTAARTMISLSMQLSNQAKVNETLKILVSDITSTMKVMSLFIAPMVLGVTTSLQKIVVITISNISSSQLTSNLDLSNIDVSNLPGGSLPSTFSNLNVSSFIKPEAVAQMASPTEFIAIIAIYVIELVIIMTYFTTKVEEDNDLLLKINIGMYFPIAIGTFILSIIVSNALIGGFLAAGG